jgi:hypothetical protein
MATAMAQVFISYRHVVPDEQLAGELASYFDEHNITYFKDTGIRIGTRWIDEIDNQLRACQSMVVFLSQESILSDMVRKEISVAQQLGKNIFPVRVNYDGALPYDIGAYIDPIQHRMWRKGESLTPICGAILDRLREGWDRTGMEPSPDALRRLCEVTEIRGAPLPLADPRPETGAMKLDSPFYVRRATDALAESLVTENGHTLLIRGPRQVGKTSLAARLRAVAEQNGQSTCYIDFQLVDESRFQNFGTLLKYLAARLARDAQTTVKPTEIWDDILGDTDSLSDFIEKGILQERERPFVLFLDEVDNIFNYPYRDAFFAVLRAWHNRRATRKLWNYLNLVITHSTEPALFIQDLNQSPFNVGTRVDCDAFTRAEIRWLNQQYGNPPPLSSSEDLEMLLLLVGAHPYLIRQSLYVLRTSNQRFQEFKNTATDDRGPFGDHLRRHAWALGNNERLKRALKHVVAGNGCDDEDAYTRLLAAGLIKGDNKHSAKPACELYRTYFRTRL